MRSVLLLALVFLAAGCTGAPDQALPGPGGNGTTRVPEEDPCPRLAVDRAEETTRVGEPARFHVVVDNCTDSALATDVDNCYRGTAGVVVNLGLPAGPRALLLPSVEAGPADAAWGPCEPAAAQTTLLPGTQIDHGYSWDGSVSPFCPDRVADEPCVGTRAPAPGVYEVAASFAWTEGDRFALSSIVLVDDATPRVPVIVVVERYTKTGGANELPAQGAGCADFAVTREPWTATRAREGIGNVSAVVVREFPQGGFGAFGPQSLALVESQPLAVTSVFDPGRTLGVLEAIGGAFFLDGQPLASGPQTVQSGYDVAWNGESYHVAEVVTAQRMGEAYLFDGAGGGC